MGGSADSGDTSCYYTYAAEESVAVFARLELEEYGRHWHGHVVVVVLGAC